MSPAIFLPVGSGPDVFADALVPAGAGYARCFPFPTLLLFLPDMRDLASQRVPLRRWLLVCEERTVNGLLTARQTRVLRALSVSARCQRIRRIYTAFIATIKPPFKLDQP